MTTVTSERCNTHTLCHLVTGIIDAEHTFTYNGLKKYLFHKPIMLFSST